MRTVTSAIPNVVESGSPEGDEGTIVKPAEWGRGVRGVGLSGSGGGSREATLCLGATL